MGGGLTNCKVALLSHSVPPVPVSHPSSTVIAARVVLTTGNSLNLSPELTIQALMCAFLDETTSTGSCFVINLKQFIKFCS